LPSHSGSTHLAYVIRDIDIASKLQYPERCEGKLTLNQRSAVMTSGS